MKMNLCEKSCDYLLYDVTGDINGMVEIQFDNNLFNGVVCYCDQNSEEFVSVSKQDIGVYLYDKIVSVAIEDYNAEVKNDR